MKPPPAQPPNAASFDFSGLEKSGEEFIVSMIPRNIRMMIAVLVVILVALGGMTLYVRIFKPNFLLSEKQPKGESSRGQVNSTPEVKGLQTSKPDKTTSPPFLPINVENWSGLDHFIIDQSNLWKIKNKNTTVDPVVRYRGNQSQKGGFAFSLLWTPQASKPNLNIYFGGYFREEIGSGDLSTSRLFTNNIGCENGSIQNATESARYIMTAKKTRFRREVLTKDSIDTKGKVIVTLMVFQRDNQNIASLAINYLSKVTGKRETYGFENMETRFEIGSLCDRRHIPNLSASSELIGFGVAPNTADNANKIEGYFFQPFDETDYNSKNLVLPDVE